MVWNLWYESTQHEKQDIHYYIMGGLFHYTSERESVREATVLLETYTLRPCFLIFLESFLEREREGERGREGEKERERETDRQQTTEKNLCDTERLREHSWGK